VSYDLDAIAAKYCSAIDASGCDVVGARTVDGIATVVVGVVSSPPLHAAVHAAAVRTTQARRGRNTRLL
jgi:hypothetical protein